MEDRQLQLAKQDYAGTREMLRRVGILAVDDIKTVGVSPVYVPKATFSKLAISCLQPDGTWKVFNILLGERPTALPGTASLKFEAGNIEAVSIGSGTLFIRVTDDMGSVVGYWEAVGLVVRNTLVTFTMPDRLYVMGVEVGHL